ncbi:hypothetical protein QFZ77_000882 [Paenibacillus sp. V4I3]|nr:hypothetical protein [Paenibacillus sp. V4I3]MDQ0872223.1 hypothetical protein [Paenibacillus sp. V4I3]
MLDLEEMLPNANEDLPYPFALEKELMQAIRMGKASSRFSGIGSPVE